MADLPEPVSPDTMMVILLIYHPDMGNRGTSQTIVSVSSARSLACCPVGSNLDVLRPPIGQDILIWFHQAAAAQAVSLGFLNIRHIYRAFPNYLLQKLRKAA